MIKLFEVGMYNGGTTDVLIDIFERVGVDYEVYGFEPAKDMWEFLLEKYKNNPKVKVFNVAVSNFDGEAKLYNTPNKDGRTLCVTKWNAQKENFELCKVIKFSDWFEQTGMVNKGSDDLYIIDCNIEGSEYEFYADLMDFGAVEYIDLFVGSLGDLYKIGKDPEPIESFLNQLKETKIEVLEFTAGRKQNLDIIEEVVTKLSPKGFVPPTMPAEPKQAKFTETESVKPWFMDLKLKEEKVEEKAEEPVKKHRKKKIKKVKYEG
ncbi:MAG: FkbM family methyltransferase [Candidatus Shapirobacteria bacterium]